MDVVIFRVALNNTVEPSNILNLIGGRLVFTNIVHGRYLACLLISLLLPAISGLVPRLLAVVAVAVKLRLR